MTKYLPRYLQEKYSILLKRFHGEIFDFVGTMEVLGYKDKRYVGKILSRLNKAGWIFIDRDPIDRRKKIYKLQSPDKIMESLEESSNRAEVKIKRISEKELQRKVASLLFKNGVQYVREPRFGTGLRPDFIIPSERILLELETEYCLSKGRTQDKYRNLADIIKFNFVLLTEKRVVEGDLKGISFLRDIFLEYDWTTG